MDKVKIETLWECACDGNIESLKVYFENGGEMSRRFKAFGGEHSLIMGAYRNNNFETVEYLLSVGEAITPEEKKMLNREMDKILCLRKILG